MNRQTKLIQHLLCLLILGSLGPVIEDFATPNITISSLKLFNSQLAVGGANHNRVPRQIN